MGRRWGTPWEPKGEEDICDHRGYDDTEKNGHDDYDDSFDFDRYDTCSSASSSMRDFSGSQKPMLRGHAPRRRFGFYFYRVPHKITRYLCLILATAILLFIVHLVRMARISSTQLEMAKPANKDQPQEPTWGTFGFLKRYYGGIRTLVPRRENVPEFPGDNQIPDEENTALGDISNHTVPFPTSVPFDPYIGLSSDSYATEFGKMEECFLDDQASIRVPKVHHYHGVTRGFPDVAYGSYQVLDLRDDVCFDRYGRYGPYGYGYSVKRGGLGAGLHGEREGADDMWDGQGAAAAVDYTNIRWAKVQDNCVARNAHRFNLTQTTQRDLFLSMGDNPQPPFAANSTARKLGDSRPGKSRVPRTAILLRVWWDMEYTPEDILYLRSLISELSLNTGGEYSIHFLVHVRDDNSRIWAEQKIYDRVLENALPAEFRGMGTLWNERQMSLIYGGLHDSFFRNMPVHGVYRGSFLPVQYFAHQNPQYEYVWNWEADVRYTGQWYHLVDKIRSWAKSQPRKGLWERNGRFYIPSVHGSWEDFRQMVRVQSEMGTDDPNNIWSSLKTKGDGSSDVQPKHDTPVWGPLAPKDVLEGQQDITPPGAPEQDLYQWGVGEEADLITLTPIFDPDGTTWFYKEDLTGYNTTASFPPRRAALTATYRLSQRLLTTMHRETVLKRHLTFTEMWPASIALHHGYKAVYAPHPTFIDRRWPTKYLSSVLNGGRNGATGGARTSVFGDREHNLRGTSYSYKSGFAPNLWSRWLGFKVDGEGGEKAEKAGEGRMCIPGVLLHPVRGVRIGTEGGERIKEDQD